MCWQGSAEDLAKVGRLISNLQEQEQGYFSLLQTNAVSCYSPCATTHTHTHICRHRHTYNTHTYFHTHTHADTACTHTHADTDMHTLFCGKHVHARTHIHTSVGHTIEQYQKAPSLILISWIIQQNGLEDEDYKMPVKVQELFYLFFFFFTPLWLATGHGEDLYFVLRTSCQQQQQKPPRTNSCFHCIQWRVWALVCDSTFLLWQYRCSVMVLLFCDSAVLL